MSKQRSTGGPRRLTHLSATSHWRQGLSLKKIAAMLAAAPRPTVGNTGVHHLLEPYAGPKEFVVHNPAALAAYRGTGPAPVGFLVRRDEHLFLPYGGFRILWRGKEVGRNLSYPDYDACARLRAEHRASRVRSEGLRVGLTEELSNLTEEAA